MAVVAMFGIYMVSSILLSVMAVYAKNLTGIDAYAGMMTSVFTFGALAVRFLTGGLVDRLGSKKIILTGIGLMIIGSSMFLNCQGITQALFARGVQGIGFGLSATATSTYIATICHSSRLLEGISYTAVAQSLSAVIGPSIGFWLIGTEYDQFQVLFLAAVGIALVTLFIMIFEKNNHVLQDGHAANDEKSQKIMWSLLLVPVLILFMNSLTQSAIVSFLALFAISMNFVGVGSFFSINAVGMISSRFIMNRLVRRYGEFQMILVNTIIFTLSVFLLTQVNSIFQMLLLAFPAGFAMGSVAPIVNTNMILTMPDHKKGLANAVYFSTLDIGYGLGSIAWGVIAMSMGYVQVFYFAALLQGVAAVLTFLQIKAVGKNNQKKAVTLVNDL